MDSTFNGATGIISLKKSAHWRKVLSDLVLTEPFTYGIDIIAMDIKLREKVGIQVKSGDADDLTTFVNAIEYHDYAYGILVYGKNISSTGQRCLAYAKKKIIVLTIEDLEAQDIPFEPKSLHDYQLEAVEEAGLYFERHDRGLLTMDCGLGKTLVALHVMNKIALGGSRCFCSD